MVEAIGLQIFGNVGIHEHQLAIFDRGIALGDGRLATAQGLHLGAREHEPGLDRVDDLEIVAGLAVIGRDLEAGIVGHASYVGSSARARKMRRDERPHRLGLRVSILGEPRKHAMLILDPAVLAQLELAVISRMAISTPMMPRICASMKGSGASGRTTAPRACLMLPA